MGLRPCFRTALMIDGADLVMTLIRVIPGRCERLYTH